METPDKIERALTIAAPMVREGLITIEDVKVIKYSHRLLHPLPADTLVREVMTPKPVSVTTDTPVVEIIDALLRRGLKAVPVLGPDGQVEGIISDGDLMQRGGIPARLAVAEHLDKRDLQDFLQQLKVSGLKAQDIMTQPVVTVAGDTPLAHAAKRLVDHNLKRMPVVDAQGSMVGILSRYDLLAATAPEAVKPHPEGLPGLAHAGNTVADVMTQEFVTVAQDASLPDLVETMVKSRVKRLVVVDPANRALGVVTDGDLVARVVPEARGGVIMALARRGKAPNIDLTAHDLMSPNLLEGPEDTLVGGALQQMLQSKRKRFYVIDDQGRVMGIVDRQGLMAAVIGEARNGTGLESQPNT